jgi:hypothetical protein
MQTSNREDHGLKGIVSKRLGSRYDRVGRAGGERRKARGRVRLGVAPHAAVDATLTIRPWR